MGKKVDVELTEVHKIAGPPAHGANQLAKHRRSSVDQPKPTNRTTLRHTQSHSSQRRPPSIPTIPETSDEEVSKNARVIRAALNRPRKLSAASGAIVKTGVRDSARSDKSGRSHASHGSLNRGFESMPDGDVLSYQSPYSSNQSISTQKEQYCCTPNCRFTPRERKLCSVVGILATIVVILVIVVGYLADHKGGDNTFRWSL